MQLLQCMGNLGADAQVQTVNGNTFVSFKVADTQKFTNQKGEAKETTTWISCAWSGDGGRLLPFLKKGVKVYVVGRPSYRVYSSQKQRMMMAGVDMHVISIELAGGSSDDVPRQLVEASTGAIVDVSKYYWVANLKSCQLIDKQGREYNVDDRGFVTAANVPASEETEAETKQGDANDNKDEIF